MIKSNGVISNVLKSNGVISKVIGQGATSAASAALLFNDQFTDTDATKLINHTPDENNLGTGTDWLAIANEGCKIYSNGVGRSSSSTNFVYSFLDVASADRGMILEVTLPWAATASSAGEVLFRFNSDVGSSYDTGERYFWFDNNGSSIRAEINEKPAGSGILRASQNISSTLAAVAEKTFYILHTASILRLYDDDKSTVLITYDTLTSVGTNTHLAVNMNTVATNATNYMNALKIYDTTDISQVP